MSPTLQNSFRTATQPVQRRENTVRITPTVRLTPVQKIGKYFTELHPDMTEQNRLFAYEFYGKWVLRWALAVVLLTVWVLTA